MLPLQSRKVIKHIVDKLLCLCYVFAFYFVSKYGMTYLNKQRIFNYLVLKSPDRQQNKEARMPITGCVLKD